MNSNPKRWESVRSGTQSIFKDFGVIVLIGAVSISHLALTAFVMGFYRELHLQEYPRTNAEIAEAVLHALGALVAAKWTRRFLDETIGNQRQDSWIWRNIFVYMNPLYILCLLPAMVCAGWFIRARFSPWPSIIGWAGICFLYFAWEARPSSSQQQPPSTAPRRVRQPARLGGKKLVYLKDRRQQ